jgi:hypothetical protein
MTPERWVSKDRLDFRVNLRLVQGIPFFHCFLQHRNCLGMLTEELISLRNLSKDGGGVGGEGESRAGVVDRFLLLASTFPKSSQSLNRIDLLASRRSRMQ